MEGRPPPSSTKILTIGVINILVIMFLMVVIDSFMLLMLISIPVLRGLSLLWDRWL